MKYDVIFTVTFEVEVDENSECPERDAEAIIEARLDDDDTVVLYNASATRPYRVD